MAKPVSFMTERESWAAAGFQALARLFLLGVFLCFFGSGGSLCAKVLGAPFSNSSLIVDEIVQKLLLHYQIPQSLLAAKAEKFFPNLEDQTVSEDFHDICEVFVKECSQGKALYLRSRPQDEALNTARPLVRFLEGRVAYLHLSAPDIQSNQKKSYIRFIRKIVRRLSRRPLKGWVIDLRDCSGHDAKTLLAGCVDLFQEGPLGLIEDEKGSLIKNFSKQNNKLSLDEKPLEGGGRLPERLLQSPKKIAVLQGEGTEGAGEILLLSFKSQKATKTFGGKTPGILWHYKSVLLKRGGYLLLQAGRFFDFKGNSFVTGVQPDIFIPNLSEETDAVLNQALMWVLDIS